jgi:hypothetical protein
MDVLYVIILDGRTIHQFQRFQQYDTDPETVLIDESFRWNQQPVEPTNHPKFVTQEATFPCAAGTIVGLHVILHPPSS